MYASLTSLSADRQDNFFSFQKKRIGEEDMATNPKGWLADAAGQQLLGAIVQASTHYLDTIDYGRRYGSASIPFVNGTRTPELSGDNFHVWASVHAHCSSHPTHVHPGASLSGVIYLSAPPDTGSLGALPALLHTPLHTYRPPRLRPSHTPRKQSSPTLVATFRPSRGVWLTIHSRVSGSSSRHGCRSLLPPKPWRSLLSTRPLLPALAVLCVHCSLRSLLPLPALAAPRARRFDVSDIRATVFGKAS